MVLLGVTAETIRSLLMDVTPFKETLAGGEFSGKWLVGKPPDAWIKNKANEVVKKRNHDDKLHEYSLTSLEIQKDKIGK